MMEEIVERLKLIGLNSYEAKVYLALLKQHPATGYEVSKESGVPQARAYDTLKTLESKKLVVATEGKPVTYIPVSPDDILKRFEKQYQSSIDYLRSTLPSYTVESIEPVYNIRGRDVIFKHVVEQINSAQETIFLEICKEDEDYVRAALKQAVDRGVTVHVVGYGDISYDFCKVHPHPLPPQEDGMIKSTFGSRWIILAVDTVEALVSNAEVGAEDSHAVWTRNPAIVLLIKEMIVHDIFLLDIETRLKEPLERVYGCQPLKLRNTILGNEILIGAH